MREQKCSCKSCRPRSGMNRRDFIKASGAGAALTALTSWDAMAGPFTREDFERLVPSDKKLRPEWVRSLFERGDRTSYQGEDLDKIGMPIGGLCAGQLYLGGDGRLWHWDIFNQETSTGAEHYAKPMPPRSPLEQNFALSLSSESGTEVRCMDRSGWKNITFVGEYPMGFVTYQDPASPIRVSLEAFSPFIPLNVEDSSFPITVMRFTVENLGSMKVQAELAGWLENAVCLFSGQNREGEHRNRLHKLNGLTFLECSAGPRPPDETREKRPDILFEDFEKESYAGWTVTGTAFGAGPVDLASVPAYQGDVRGRGSRVVNSHASAPGKEVGERDAAQGTLTSPAFVIERNFICFLVGGGNHPGKTCVNLLIDEQVVLSQTGSNDNAMKPATWKVSAWAGKTGRIQIVDEESGPWGNIGVDHILFTDQPSAASIPLEQETDYGTLGLALLEHTRKDRGVAGLPNDRVPSGLFEEDEDSEDGPVSRPFGQKLMGSLSRRLTLKPGQSETVTFLIAWHFPNLRLSVQHGLTGRHYATRFDSALAAAQQVSDQFDSLRQQTLLWHDTWYESTLPYWFLDRTFLNTSILATSTSHRVSSGRFYGWEGVGCCAGTCGHVWQYAQAMARLFPELERDTRQRVDLGLALKPDGAIHFRGEFNDFPAVDGQAGVILRVLREHQMCSDNAWLLENWPKVKLALQWLIAKDENDDGLIEGNQHNTLDTDWFGPVAWLSGEYLAALKAGEAMAIEAQDEAFAGRCRRILEKGPSNLVSQLFNGEYFINKPDPGHPEAINSGAGCHIDQVFGQSWAFQVGLGRVLPATETRSALQSLWRYNFCPDVGPWRDANKPGRWYAMPGEAGLIMCTFPKPEWGYDKAKGTGADWAAGYFNECMNGFEYQVAGHMIWEGLLMEGLAITRAIHDRYHASRRNPWNEVECGDHYARSMASYGVFLAACGYQHHGPKGLLGFAPRMKPEDFRAAFTTGTGWGSFSQSIQDGQQKEKIEVRWGEVKLKKMSFEMGPGVSGKTVAVSMDHLSVASQSEIQDNSLVLSLEEPITLKPGDTLEVTIQ